MVIVDMHAPGVTVRPLRQITGETHFNEVFLDEVRVPVANVVGDVNDGWRVARTMLAFERQALGNVGGGGGGGGFMALIEEAERRGLDSRPVLRDHLVQLRIRQMVLRYLSAYLQAKAKTKTKGGGAAAASLLKLAMTQLVQQSALVGVEASGLHAMAWDPEDSAGRRWSDQLLGSQSASIGGGTNQIVRNVIAERELGLPRDTEGDLMPGDLDKEANGSVARDRPAP